MIVEKLAVKPSSELLAIPLEYREQWATALDSSVQKHCAMSNEGDTAHCCLCVLERIHGATYKNYGGAALPSGMVGVTPQKVNGKLVENIIAGIDQHGGTHKFSSLNDSYLTHKQIASLLRGNTVETV